MPPNIALVYDRVNKVGGAERVLTSLHQLYPQAPLFTAVYEPKNTPWASTWDVRPSFVDHLPLIRRHHQLLAPFMPYAFESFDLAAYDLVISVTSAEAKGVITQPATRHLSYLLTPPRYLWHQTQLHTGSGLLKTARLPFMSALRRWDYLAAQRPDHILTISHSVQARIKKYYGRKAQVIYPPVDCEFFSLHPPRCYTPLREYFLLVSRLEPYKQVDLVIRAFQALKPESLIIIGTGSELTKLRSMASGNPQIQFVPSVSDHELNCYYHHAKALIFPQEEDFGLVAVEAQSAGLPVIAYKRGGATETVLDGQTGIFFDDLTPASLVQGIQRLAHSPFSPEVIMHHAKVYDKKVFIRAFTNLVETMYGS